MSQVVEIVVKVQDGASQPLARVEKQLGRTGRAARDASADIWQFNKTIFSTMAFAGLFARAFGSVKSAMDVGAPLDRMTTQFERVMGPRGEFLQAFKETTNSVVDEFSLMESGLHLGQLGITKTSKETADVLAKMAVAARMAGKDSAEGVKDLTTAIADGNISKLEEYGIMRKTNPMYMAMLATINKAGGIYGATLVKQQQLALAMKVLTAHTKDHMFMFMSTGEVVDAVGKKFRDVKQHIGTFLATALRPLLEKLIPFLDKLSDTLFYLYRNDKQIMFLTRSVLALAAGLGTLFATLGTVALAVKLLGFAGIGIPGLITSVLGLGLAFHGLTKDADGVLEKFRVIGAIFKGVYELVTNLDPETGMSKISKSTRDLLEKYGLLGFTKTIARIVSIIKTVLTDIYNVFSKTVSVVNVVFGGMFNKLRDIIANFTSDWTTWWTSDAISPLQKFVRAATTLLAPLLAFFAFKGLKWGLSKFTGGLFGGSAPKGTKGDPIYTRAADGIASHLTSAGGALGGWGGKILDKLSGPIAFLLKPFRQLGIVLDYLVSYGLRGFTYAMSESIVPLLRSIGSIAGRVIAPLLVFGSALYGVVQGIIDKSDDFSKYLTGVFDILSLPFQWGAAVAEFIGNLPIVQDAFREFKDEVIKSVNTIMTVTKALFIDLPTWILKSIMDGWKLITTDIAAPMLGWAGEKMSRFAEFAKPTFHKETKKTATALPSDEEIVKQLNEQMTKVSEGKKAELQYALSAAMSSKEADGRFISPEEYSSLLGLFKEALDTSENMKAMANKARQPDYLSRQPNRPN